MNFPKRCVMEEGSIYMVTFEHIKQDWASTVKQFDDLSEEGQNRLIEEFDDDQAQIWWNEQWYGFDIVGRGEFQGVDDTVRNEFLERALNNCSDWSYEYESE